MRLSIATRLRPFSSLSGSTACIPGAPFGARVYPGRIEILDLRGPRAKQCGSLNFGAIGPVRDFKVVLDLEKACVRVWGEGRSGYFRYRLSALSDQESLGLFLERAPESGISCSVEGDWLAQRASSGGQGLHPAVGTLREKELLLLTRGEIVPFPEFYQPPSLSRLSLGAHKGQDWELMHRRVDLKELLPVWQRLGSLYSAGNGPVDEGVLAIVSECRVLLQSGEKLRLAERLRELFILGFAGIMCPKLEDTEHLGYDLPPVRSQSNASLMDLLALSGSLVQDLFIQASPDSLSLLPASPPDCHCGRFLAFKAPWGEVDLEWSKKAVRRVIIRAEKTAELSLSLSKSLTSYRMRCNSRDAGARIDADGRLRLEAGQHYFLDRFER